MACEFITELWLERQGETAELQGFEFRRFKQDYRRHLRSLGVPLEVAAQL